MTNIIKGLVTFLIIFLFGSGLSLAINMSLSNSMNDLGINGEQTNCYDKFGNIIADQICIIDNGYDSQEAKDKATEFNNNTWIYIITFWFYAGLAAGYMGAREE